MDARSQQGDRKIKVLAASSAGGHWEQLMLLRPALEKFTVVFATSNPQLGERHGLRGVLALPESNRNRPLRVLRCIVHAWRLVREVRPDVVITTGALPGLLVLICGRVSGAHTIWLDSVANSERLSMSGRWARFFASRWLTQWAPLSGRHGPEFVGALL
ncbi:glucuronosyltransferase [Sphingobium aromaticiconvertens]|uniref:glucuronosyltransferase n=1 Tax=Sphingobium aromaticiconvertens TaxID=365341 RepID=UPI003017A25D